MKDSSTPSFNDILTIVANLVSNLPRPSEIFAETQNRNRLLWPEAWCDGCIAGKGFPPKGKDTGLLI